MSLERVGDFRDVDYAIQFMLYELMRHLDGKITKRNDEDIYLMADLKCAAENPDVFRQNAYCFQDIRYCNHQKNKRGKLVKIEAYFKRRKKS